MTLEQHFNLRMIFRYTRRWDWPVVLLRLYKVQGATPAISAAVFKQYISNIVFAIIPANQSGVEISDPGAAVPMYADNIFQHMSAKNFANLLCTINSRTNVLWCTDCIANGITCGIFFQVSDNGVGRNQVDRICPLGPFVGL
jgi:hypothetical protein